MSSSLLTKTALGVLGAGTVTTGAIYFGKDLLGKEDVKTTTPIKELLKSVNPHKRLISKSEKGDSQEWKAAWKAYKGKYKDQDSNPFSLSKEKLKSSEGEDNAPPEFMSKCSSMSGEKVVDGSDTKYQTVLSYCTRDALISDLITERNPKKALLLETEETGKWKASWQEYQAANTEKTQSKDKWGLSDWGTKNADSDAPESFKKECKKRYESKTETASQDDYLNVLNWCTKTL
ncbi:hypothetical protein MHF_0305 [Mycoplasma haemofelis Ohio2]|uniref:Uncharacterized protein n=1 Tax=Mycoplasma haemofelis (strain Ohio2) TaxID=859194 RepID=F6FGR2_MYCHI|nr:hypothetical protein MHF_0305 [Mycoplasma haemofelis Ohio2]